MFNYTPPGPINPAPINIKGGIKFDDADPVIDNTLNGRGTAASPLGIIQINGGDVTLTTPAYFKNVNFTTTQICYVNFC